jgi:hypothetical protein
MRELLHAKELAGSQREVEWKIGIVTSAAAAQHAKHAGYEIELHYLWLLNVELASRRVRQQVRKGGHAVPADDQNRVGPSSMFIEIRPLRRNGSPSKRANSPKNCERLSLSTTAGECRSKIVC